MGFGGFGAPSWGSGFALWGWVAGCYAVAVFGIGYMELMVLVVTILLLFPPQELPKLARSAARIYGTLRRTADEFQRTVMMDDELRKPIDEIRGAYDDARWDLHRATTRVRDELRGAVDDAKEVAEHARVLEASGDASGDHSPTAEDYDFDAEDPDDLDDPDDGEDHEPSDEELDRWAEASLAQGDLERSRPGEGNQFYPKEASSSGDDDDPKSLLRPDDPTLAGRVAAGDALALGPEPTKPDQDQADQAQADQAQADQAAKTLAEDASAVDPLGPPPGSSASSSRWRKISSLPVPPGESTSSGQVNPSSDSEEKSQPA